MVKKTRQLLLFAIAILAVFFNLAVSTAIAPLIKLRINMEMMVFGSVFMLLNFVLGGLLFYLGPKYIEKSHDLIKRAQRNDRR